MSLRQIAQNLDLSITTVSRALGGHSDVSEATRERIAREAERIGYVPNEMARRLQKGRADALGIVFPGGPETFDDTYLLMILEGAWDRLAEREMDLLVYPTAAGPREAGMYKRLVEGRRVDGLILTRVRDDDPRVDYLLGINFPFVTIGAGTFEDPRILSADVDNVDAMRKVLLHLKEFGHQVIACAGPNDLRFAATRHQVFLQVARELGLTPVAITEEGSPQGGEKVIARLLEAHPDVTALVCIMDRVTLGVLSELRRRGLVAGADLSVVSFGDTQLTRMSQFQVSALRLPIRDLAVTAVDLLLRRLDGMAIGRQVDHPVELISRDTVAAPKHR
jgi:LacI family transcriptional regulator